MVRKILLILGLSLCLYPCIANVIFENERKNIIESYEEYIEHMEKTEREKEIEQAKEYNATLADEICPQDYEKCLNFGKEGMMGILRIPCIDISLPIYHGTNESVLEKGVGHIQKSSLPVGGVDTHCLLAGHRGLPNAQLFTDLGKVRIGEKIYVDVLGKTYIYEVNEIQTIQPEETEKLHIQKEKDLISLITCTPYGINTHRLVVTGERVDEK